MAPQRLVSPRTYTRGEFFLGFFFFLYLFYVSRKIKMNDLSSNYGADVGFSFGAVDRGWKVKYIPLCLATGVCPDSPRAFFSQQMRWARGSTTLLTNSHFWVSSLTFMQKVCYLSGKAALLHTIHGDCLCLN